MKKTLILIFLFLTTLISAQELKVYEGELYLHKVIYESVVNNHCHCGFSSEFSRTGSYHYYESEGKRILHGDYIIRSGAKYLKGAFKHGKMDGIWELGFDKGLYTGMVPPFYQRFTYVDGEIYGPFEIYHSFKFNGKLYEASNIYEYKYIRANINDSRFVGEYYGETVGTYRRYNDELVSFKKTHTGQFDEEGWATGEWVNTTTEQRKGVSGTIETKEYKKGILQKTTKYQDWLGEIEVKYENTDEVLNINGQEIVLRKNDVGIYNYKTKGDILLVREGGYSDEYYTQIELRNYPFREYSYDQNASYLYDAYCKELEQKRYIDEYTESVKDKIFHLPYGTYPKWSIPEIIQEITCKLEKRHKGSVRCRVIVNAEGIITEITELAVFNCKKSEIVQQLLEEELPGRIIGMKVEQYFHAIPAPKEQTPSNRYKQEEVSTWKEVKIPVKYTYTAYVGFDSKK